MDTLANIMQNMEYKNCKICNKEEVLRKNGKVINLSIDHNHKTGEIRDLLCSACNYIIGRAGESQEILRSAALYIEKHSKK